MLKKKANKKKGVTEVTFILPAEVEGEVENESVQAKDPQELGSDSLQSLDDLEASYRQKGNRFYKGYVVNVTDIHGVLDRLSFYLSSERRLRKWRINEETMRGRSLNAKMEPGAHKSLPAGNAYRTLARREASAKLG